MIIIMSNSKGKAYNKKVETNMFLGKKIGDTINLDTIGLKGYEAIITGGSDRDGFPMHPKLEGTIRKRLLVKAGFGLKSDVKGIRKRRLFRGNTVSNDINQLNVKITKHGEKTIEELLGIKTVEKPQQKQEKNE